MLREQCVQTVLKMAKEKGSKATAPPVYATGKINRSSEVVPEAAAGAPPSRDAFWFLAPAQRDDDVVAIPDAMPEAFANHVAAQLRALPDEAWKVLAPDKEHVGALTRVQERQGVGGIQQMKLMDMRYSRVQEHCEGLDRPAIAEAVGKALQLRSHERLIMNFARYRAGDYLCSHTDHPSGNGAYERRRAFVWHLSSKEWDESDGGHFVDEKLNVRFAPKWNTLVHFGVPRWHRVDKVARHVKGARYSVYSWIITACVRTIATVAELAQLKQSAPSAVVGWFGPAPLPPLRRAGALDLAACCLGRVGIDELRGEQSVYAVTTSEEVARALGLSVEDAAGDSVAVVRWEDGRVTAARLGHQASGLAGVQALGEFLDAHKIRSKAKVSNSKMDHAQFDAIIEQLMNDVMANRGKRG